GNNLMFSSSCMCFFFFQAEDGIRDFHVTGVQTCALPISHLGIAEANNSLNLVWLYRWYICSSYWILHPSHRVILPYRTQVPCKKSQPIRFLSRCLSDRG